ncbi:MAG: hypothetical protein J6W52_04815 [Bacteroidaceae bacterium]|nr:hypothetical protein [Bacteroidaceae bacterium]
MKNLLFLFFAFTPCLCVCAQDKIIKMPESPSINQNIAENDKGFWCAAEVGGGSTLMVNRKNVAMVGTSFSAGYRFSQYLKVGAGLGLLYYPNNDNVRNSDCYLAMPIFVNARGNFLSDEIRRTVPFWSVNIGSTIPDGFFMTPSVGLRIGEKRSAFLVSLGYTLRHLKTYPGNIKYYNGVLVKLGYEF